MLRSLYSISYMQTTPVYSYLVETLTSLSENSMLNLYLIVTEWLKANKVTLNTEKNYYMVFHRCPRKTLSNIKLLMDDNIIKESPHINMDII